MQKKKIILGVAAFLVVTLTVVAMSAFEAHIINVTARIENALNVPIKELRFGTVFPQEELDQSFTVALSESFRDQANCNETNLLENGGFESPVVTDDAKWDIYLSGTTGLGWTVEWRSDIPASWGGYPRPAPALQELHHGVLGAAAEGDQYAELDTDWDGPGGSLNGEPASVMISQEIATVPGRTYHLRFAFSPRPNTASANNELGVYWEGVQVAVIGPEAGVGSNVWTYYEYDLVASGSSATLAFEDEGTADSLGTFLDDVSLVECGRVTTVDYVLRQKPKCWDLDVEDPQFGLVTEVDGEFICEDENFVPLPLLCPYLSKHKAAEETDENDETVDAFHGDPSLWDLAAVVADQLHGQLSVPLGDYIDEWVIDLKVPCFRGMCAQDYEEWVDSFNLEADPDVYMLNPNDESKLFGCDLWLEVTGIDGINVNH